MRTDSFEKLKEWVAYLNSYVEDKTLLGRNFSFQIEEITKSCTYINAVILNSEGISIRSSFRLLVIEIERQGLFVEAIYWRFSSPFIFDLIHDWENLTERAKFIKPHDRFDDLIQELDSGGLFNVWDQ